MALQSLKDMATATVSHPAHPEGHVAVRIQTTDEFRSRLKWQQEASPLVYHLNTQRPRRGTTMPSCMSIGDRYVRAAGRRFGKR